MFGVHSEWVAMKRGSRRYQVRKMQPTWIAGVLGTACFSDISFPVKGEVPSMKLLFSERFKEIILYLLSLVPFKSCSHTLKDYHNSRRNIL